MIVDLDASALVKRYVAEEGSDGVASLVDAAAVVGTSIISRAEIASVSFRQDMVGERVTVATFDHRPWKAAHTAALGTWPEGLA